MSRRDFNLRIKKLVSDIFQAEGLEISFGRILEEWEEPLGPTPFPSITDLRRWDHILLERYKPFYMPFCDLCCLCTMGKCDLTSGKRGACGIDMPAQQSRIVLLAACIGAATHAAHARHLLEYLVSKYGRDHPIDLGGNIYVEAPIIRLVCGIKPRILGDLEDALSYVEEQIISLLAATHTGQEDSWIDFESKVFHAGMLDHVALEIADLAQIVALGYPKGDPEAPLVEIGLAAIDQSKPVILVVGHNVPSAASIVDYLVRNRMYGAVEVAGICCTAHDVSRYNPMAKIVGPLSWQLRFVRSGLPDVVVVDEQCIRADILLEAARVKAPVIATSIEKCMGLPDATSEPIDSIVEKLVSGSMQGILFLDPDRVGELAVKTALKIFPYRQKIRSLPSDEDLKTLASKCRGCRFCERACPNNLPIAEAMNAASKGDFNALAYLYEICIGCGKCEETCPQRIPVHSVIIQGARKIWRNERFKIRVGRGPIQDVEIRNVGRPIVFGEIPGVIAFVGCSNYYNGGREIVEIAEEFLKRNYIVVASGCAAMTLAMAKDDEGRSLYEKYTGTFDAGGLVNVGSCISNSHIAGAAIKIAAIFAKRNLRANYEEIADYILNRVGAVGIAWGAMSQKAAAIAAGFWRLGVPVIVGPHGAKYRRLLLGRRDDENSWYVYDARTGDRVYSGPAPEHLFVAAESKEEAIVMIAKLCMRPNDTSKGRAIKLSHYIDLSKKYLGCLPDDLHLYVRKEADIPLTLKSEVLEFLKSKGWSEKPIPDPTLLPRLVRKR
ncbi:MAG: CO dehydrogenase/acetyl-CoA synthase complex subunit alpha [Candidatus Bathyarchaeia archaeon]